MKIQRACVSLVCILVLLAGSVVAAEHAKESLTVVKKNLDDEKAILVDVREKEEWDKGHVQGAVMLPLSILNENPQDAAGRLPKDKIVYTHCMRGVRSLAAANILQKLGYTVRPLKPGYKELIEAGFPTEK
jgi:phage shock protein E